MAPARRAWSKMSGMDTTAIEQFQMHGQDIPRLLEHWAEHKPEHPALVWAPREGESRRWSYTDLLIDVRRLAAGLAARGIAKGDTVLIHSENCPEMVLSWLACATLGAVAVTTNTKSVGAEVTYFAEHTRAVAAITQPQYAATVAAAAPALKWIAVTDDNSGEPADATQSAHGFDAFDSLFADAGDWTPPGTGADAPLRHHVHLGHHQPSQGGRAHARQRDLGEPDRAPQHRPHHRRHVPDLPAVLPRERAELEPLLRPRRRRDRGPDAEVVAAAASGRRWSSTRVTHISLMPFVMGALGSPERPTEHTLRVGVFGLIMPDLDKMFGIAVYAAYGMTETVTHCVTGKPQERLPTRSMGHVTPGYELAVVDKETGELCAEGETGELWMRGTRGIQLFLEYYDNDEANAKAFEDGWFKTGDMVKMGAGGNVFYQERDKDLLKVGGENVSAKEVEDLIVAHPAVQAVAVVGKSHEFLSEVVVAFVIPAPGDHDPETVSGEIVETARQNLASFKVPRAVYFVEEFPTGTLDKILKNKLREMADERPPVE